jgi:hypothetical protein
VVSLSLALLAAGVASPLDPRVAAEIDGARADGLPTRALISKAREGAAKDVSADRVVEAVAGMADDLRRARVSLGSTHPEALEPAARALGSGLREADVWRLAIGPRGAEALTAAADLEERGFSPAVAVATASLVNEVGELRLGAFEVSALQLWRSGVAPAEIPDRLRAAAAAGAFLGSSPEQATP